MSTMANAAAARVGPEPLLLEVDDLVQRYTLPRENLFQPAPQVLALNGVSVQLTAGKSLGVVGESGSGKSTFARTVMALETPTSGSVRLLGRDLHRLPADELRRARCDFQMVFQDPYGSLDPRQTVARIVAEPLTAFGRVDRAEQRGRVAAVLTQPKLIVADEPVSALDVSVQAQVLNLLEDLQDEFGLSYVLISHDLAVVEYLCDEIAVIYLGRIVEQGRPEDLFNRCAHPYTRALLEAVPRARPGRERQRRGTQVIASQSRGSTGCAYAGRCPYADAHCRAVAPVARSVGSGHCSACHHAETIMALPALAGEV